MLEFSTVGGYTKDLKTAKMEGWALVQDNMVIVRQVSNEAGADVNSKSSLPNRDVQQFQCVSFTIRLTIKTTL